MSISLSSLLKDRSETVVKWGEEDAVVVFRPSGYTPEVEARAQENTEKSRPGAGLAEILADVLISWDVVGDDDKPLPTDVQTLSMMPGEFLVAVFEAVTYATADLREERKNSGAGSRRRAK